MKNKKIILIAIIVILGLLIVYALITRPNGDIVLDKDKKDLQLVTDYKEFFSINSLVNDYLLNISLDQQDVVKGMSGNDVLVTNASEKYNYYAEKVYYVELSFNIYYYVTGRKMIYDYNTNKMSEIKNECYLVNVYKPNNTFKILKINDVNNYYKENDLYDKVIITSNSYNDYSKYDTYYKDDTIYNIYINYLRDLIFVNYRDAYNLLDVSYKNKIGSIDNFNLMREDIYNKLNNIVKDYSINGNSPNRSYTLILVNDTKITVIENGIMNVKYKIEN